MSIASQFRQRARAASPTIAYNEALRDAPGTAKYMESMGATGEEIKRYYEDIELSKLNSSQDWLSGVKRANAEYQRSTNDAATSAARAFSTSADAMTDSLTDFVTTGTLKVGDFVNTVARQFASMAINKTITAPLFNWFSGGLSAMFSASGNAFGPMGHLSAYAKGGAFNDNHPIQAFAKGSAFANTIVAEPTLFKFAKGGALGVMGEAGPEAIMPLKRAADGSLGIRADMPPLARGPESSPMVMDASSNASISISSPVTVTVNGSASGDAQADGAFANEVASKTVKRLEESMRTVVVSEIQKQMRPGGMFYRY